MAIINVLGYVGAVASYVRALISTPLFLLLTGLASIVTVVLSMMGLHKVVDLVVFFWAQTTVFIFGIKTEVEGRENIPQNQGCLFLFNHQSHLDIPVIHSSIVRRLRFGAKIELFRIPFFGQAMRAAGVLPITRQNRNKVLKVYEASQEKFMQGWSYSLAPEGTRQPEPVIGKFKNGPFIFAINSQAPIVPVVLKGAYDVLPKQSLWVNVGQWSRTVKVRFLPVVETKGMATEQLPELVEKVRAQFVETYDRL